MSAERRFESIKHTQAFFPHPADAELRKINISRRTNHAGRSTAQTPLSAMRRFSSVSIEFPIFTTAAPVARSAHVHFDRSTPPS
jgi:hypothetical protein